MEKQNWTAQEESSLVKGILGAVVGALIGMVLWVLVGMAGYVASIVAMLTAFLAGKGYDMLHGRPGKARVITIIAVVLLSVIIGTVVTDGLLLAKAYNDQMAEMNTFEQAQLRKSYPTAMDYVKETIVDEEIQTLIWKDIAVGLLFGALGTYPVLLGNWKKKKQGNALQGTQDSAADGTPEKDTEKHADA